MNKLLFIFLIPVAVTAQMTSVHFELNTTDIYPVSTVFSSCGPISEPSLAQIFAANNASNYCTAPGITYSGTHWGGVVDCNCDGAQLAAELLTNPYIVRARVSPEYGTVSNAIYVDSGDSYPEVTNYDTAHIVITGDPVLDNIYHDFAVYEQYDYSFMTWKELHCDCPVAQLKDALVASGYITGDDDTYDYMGYAVLSSPQHETAAAVVYPNPFHDSLNIRTDRSVATYRLFDVSGKQLLAGAGLDGFSEQAASLGNGIYFLKLAFADGDATQLKIIKH